MNWDVALAVAVTLVAFHAVAAILAYRFRNATVDPQVPPVDDPDTSVDGDSVECPTCGVENERDYRFCKRCVTELPRPMAFSDDSAAPFSRGVR